MDNSVLLALRGGREWTASVIKKEDGKMLGLQDPWIAVAYWLCILSSILCVVYGAINWNKGAHVPDAEDKSWAEEENELEKEL